LTVDRSTIWPYDERGEPRDFFYSRYAHPTGAAAERVLGALEGGEALLYASGMGAATTVVLALVEPGETIALAEGAYYGTAVLLRTLERWGVRVVEYDQTGVPPESADVIWVESPANPVLTLPDWDAIRGRARLLVCDATVSTPVYLKALDEGADVVLHSGTKYLAGQHDALVGATVTRDEELTTRLRTMRGQAGIPASPDAARALHNGLETLATRMRRHPETAT